MSEFGTSASGKRFGCPSCGGGLRYDILQRKMVCDRCGGTADLDALPDDRDAEDTMDVTEFHCPQCGAMIYSTDTAATGFCSFCGSDVVLTGKLGKTCRPAYIVPFTVTREDCEARYRDHLKHYHLMPRELKAAETISHFRPVYVPFWSYDVESSGEATLKASKSYTKGNYRYDEEYDLSMHADINQKGILYDASTVFEDETAAMLQHNASEAVPFHSAYLSGLYAQAADVPAETYEQEAAASAVRIFMDRVRKEYGMDSVEMSGEISEAFGLPNARYTKKLIMMPVWLLAYRQGERVIYTAVNGRDGRVVCDIPVSNRRLAGVTAGIGAAVFILLWQTLTLKPEILMLLCALLLLITQFLFTGSQTTLNNRKTRAFEPDFTGEHPTFVGPAQQMLKKKNGTVALTRAARKKERSNFDKAIKAFEVIFFAVIAVYVLFAEFGVGVELNYFFSKLEFRLRLGLYRLFPGFSRSGDPRVSYGIAAILIAMIVYAIVKSRHPESGPILPRILSCAACAAGLIFLLLGEVEDMQYYGCTVAMLLAAIWELLTVIRSHNEYASRPVPFFQEG